MNTNLTAAAELWRWFSANAEALARDYDSPAMIGAIDEIISRIGDFAWEIGPGVDDELVFVVSPDGDREKLVETRAIVAEAPVLRGWRFLPARPRRPNPYRLSLGVRDDETMIDAVNWRYVLYEYDDGACEIVLEQPGVVIAEEDRYTAALLVLDGLLGEEVTLSTFVKVDAVPEFEVTQSASASPLPVLMEHLGRLGRIPQSS